MADSTALQLDVDLSTRRPLRDEAYLALRRAILSGHFKPGDRLVEREVAESLGLSRSPVREAFRRLEQEGLIAVTRRGLFVEGLDPAEVDELYQIRQHLESLVGRLAARNFQPWHLPLLEETLSRMAAAIAAGQHDLGVDEGIKFHEALAEIAGNRRLAALVASVVEDIHRFRNLNLTIPARSQSALQEHRQILAAVAAKDEENASRLIVEHIGHAWKHTAQHGAK